MRNMGFATAMVLVLATSAQAQVYDSTGQPNTAIGYGDAIYSSTWQRVQNKPATATRWPTWDEVSSKPATATRWPTWNEVTSKPTTFPSTWGKVTGKPSVFPTNWSNVASKPSTFPSSWSNISGKPSSFPTRWSDVTGIPAVVAGGTSSLDSRYLRLSNAPNGKSCSSGYYVRGIKNNGGLNCAKLPSGGGGGGPLVCPPEYSPDPTGTWCQSNNRSCFVAGTPILMADGSLKPIEEVKVGDRVSSAHGDINVVRFHDRPIMRPGTGQMLVSINGGDYFMSNNHPVLTRDGWKAVDPVSAQNEALDILEGKVGQLAAGDVILGADGAELMTVETIDIRDDAEPVKLYNFVLDGDHTFVANGFAVHAFEPDRAGRMPIVNEHPDEDDFSLRPWNAPEGMVCTEGWNRDEYNPKGGIACWWWPTGSELGMAA